METKSALVIFEDLPIRKIEKDGQYWISILDVAKALEYKNPSQDTNGILKNNSERFRGYVETLPLKTSGGVQNLKFFNLKGVIAFCMLSEKPKAIPFQRWADSVLEKEIKNIPDDIRIIAKRKRVEFTETLKEHGYKSPKEYQNTTMDMKASLGIDEYKKKSDCDLIEVMKIATAEMLAKTNLMISGKKGYFEVNPICKNAATAIKNNTKEIK